MAIDIKWDWAYSIGNEKIDNEHKVFLDLVRSCSEDIEEGRGAGRVFRHLTELGLYARFHFYSEETLMELSGYPDAEQHIREHRELLSTFKKRVAEYERDPSTGPDLVRYLYEWFVLHTASIDQDLATFVADQA